MLIREFQFTSRPIASGQPTHVFVSHARGSMLAQTGSTVMPSISRTKDTTEAMVDWLPLHTL